MKIMQINRLWRASNISGHYALELSQLLTDHGHEIIPFAVQDPSNVPNDYSSLFVSQLELSNTFRMSLWKMLGTAARMLYSREARSRMAVLADLTKPDVAHMHRIFFHISPSVLPVLNRRGVGIVMTVHDNKLLCPSRNAYREGLPCFSCRPYHYSDCIRNKCFGNSQMASILCAIESLEHDLFNTYTDRVNFFIAPSRYMRDRLLGRGIPREKVSAIPYFIDAGQWPLSKEEDGGYALFVGQLLPQEGVTTLINAFAGLPRIPLKIAGTGIQDNRVRAMAWGLGADSIELLGYKSEQEIGQLLRGCRFLCLPYESPENVPAIVLKAFASGKPVLATRLGGLPEAVMDGITGSLFEPGDINGLRAAASDLWQNPAKCREMGLGARRLVEREYSPEQHYQRINDIYRKVKST